MAVEISVPVCENHWFKIRWICWICHWHGDDVLGISCDLSWVTLRAAIVRNNGGVCMPLMARSGILARWRISEKVRGVVSDLGLQIAAGISRATTSMIPATRKLPGS